MNQFLQKVNLVTLKMNQVAAKMSVHVEVKNLRDEKTSLTVSVECVEVGVYGSRPDSPVAVAGPIKVNFNGIEKRAVDLPLEIGTPFLWTPEAQPIYAVIVSAEQGGQVEQGEIQFGFDSGGGMIVTGEFKNNSHEPCGTNPKRSALFVVSDSTAFSNGRNQRGWGEELANFFDPEKISVRNRARPGRSTRSFRSEGLWQRVLAELKADDFVLIQFGHNDADKLAEGRCRGVLPGIGEEMQEVVMPDGTCEIVRTYGWYLRQFIAETKAHGATPILCSLTAKNIWANGRLQRNQSEHGDWARQVAKASGVDFIELNQIIADRYDELGWEKVQPLFCNVSDNVHTSPAGAEVNAACVTAGLRQLTKSPINNFLLA